MNKDAYYFPHFSNARSDRKILRLRKELQIEGYGIYFMLLEVLRDTDNYRYPMYDIDLLAEEFNTSEQKIRTVICNYGLFEVDEDNNFFSAKFDEYLQPYLKMKEQRRIAGLASAAKRSFNGRSTVVQQSKEKKSKVKKSKEEESKELLLPFFSEAFVSKWDILKSQPKWKRKTESALQASLDKLSNYPENVAIQMMNDTIAGGWQGLFEPKNIKPEQQTKLAGKSAAELTAEIMKKYETD